MCYPPKQRKWEKKETLSLNWKRSEFLINDKKIRRIGELKKFGKQVWDLGVGDWCGGTGASGQWAAGQGALGMGRRDRPRWEWVVGTGRAGVVAAGVVAAGLGAREWSRREWSGAGTKCWNADAGAPLKVVFQNVCGRGCFFDAGGGGLPNPTESTMWGMVSSGAGCYLHGILRRSAGGRLARCLRVSTCSLISIALSTDAIVCCEWWWRVSRGM